MHGRRVYAVDGSVVIADPFYFKQKEVMAMVYVTVMQSPMYRQMSVEELLFGSERTAVINDNTANTRTQMQK